MKNNDLLGKNLPLSKEDFIKYYKLVLDSLHIGILVCDSKGVITYMNHKFAEMFNIDLSTSTNTMINDFFPNSAMLEVMKTGRSDKAVKFRFKDRDALVFRTPISNKVKTIWGLVEVFFRDISEFKEIMRRMNSLEKKVDYYKRRTHGLPGSKYSFDDIIGNSQVIQALKQKGKKFAKSSQPVLILGENGTGKELVAHSIHSYSLRSSEIFLKINCASIPKDLLESELFGYEEGAFTGSRKGGKVGKFELADRGTIFLDEIGELPLTMQAKILRVIETKEIEKIGELDVIFSDFRLVAATNRNLEEAVAKGTFREDLYHRINILVLKVPPLRERIEDLPEFIQHLLNIIEDKPSDLEIKVGQNVMQLFRKYPWPGNIRELKNVLIFSLLSLENREAEIETRHLPKYMLKTSNLESTSSFSVTSSIREIRKISEKKAILEALDIAKQNKSQASKILEISRNELYRKMGKYQIKCKS